MKTMFTMMLLTACSALAPIVDAAEPKPADTSAAEKELSNRYREWEAAAVKGEGAAHFAKNAAEDYVFTSVDGVVSDKQACITALKAAVIETWKIDDVKTRVYGDTLVTTGRAVIQGKVDGKDVLDRVRFTEMHVKRDGRWQPVALQFTRIAKP